MTRLPFGSFLALVSLFLLGIPSTSPAQEEAQPFELKCRVSAALPVVGQKQTVTARLVSPPADLGEAEILFQLTHDGRTVALGPARRAGVNLGDTPAAEASVDWTPSSTGEHRVEVVLKTGGSDPQLSASQGVTVVRRPLHFHYWDMDPSLKYVTEGLVQKPEPLAYWTDRGAICQRWVGGIWAVKTQKVDTAEKLAERWTSKEWPGIVIDEFGSPGDVDRLLADALIETRKRMPGLYLAPYAICPSPESFEAFRTVADRVLVECYCPHGASGYDRIENRTKIARENGFMEKTLTVLGIGNALGKDSPTITTPVELRRQLHFLRYRFPEMSGAAFFSGFRPLYPALNDAIHRFYILPVLRVEPASEGRMRIENIGADDAETTSVSVQAGDRIVAVDVPRLAVGESTEVACPEKGRILTEFREDCTVLGPPLLWGEEPESDRPGTSLPWPATDAMATVLDESFDTDSTRLVPQPSAEGGDQKPAPSVEASFPEIAGRRLELSFDLDMVHAGFYGGFEIGLIKEGGPDRVAIQFYRGDYEPAVFAGLSVKNSEGILVAERLALRFLSKTHYHLRCCFDGEGQVRLGIWDDSGTKLWDTGTIPTYGPLAVDRLRISTRAGEKSFIKWDETEKALNLRGEMNSTYFSEGKVDNVRVLVVE